MNDIEGMTRQALDKAQLESSEIIYINSLPSRASSTQMHNGEQQIELKYTESQKRVGHERQEQ